MADLMRMLESYSRQTKQQEDKISQIKQQEEALLRDLEGARVINAQKRAALAETQARCGEMLSDLQQKRATLAESKAANENTKQVISQMQDQRQQLWDQLQQMREDFIAACATADSEACQVLHQLRGSLTAGFAVVAASGACDDLAGLQDVGDTSVGISETVVAM